jgi:hypothetical protein
MTYSSGVYTFEAGEQGSIYPTWVGLPISLKLQKLYISDAFLHVFCDDSVHREYANKYRTMFVSPLCDILNFSKSNQILVIFYVWPKWFLFFYH